MAHSIQQQIPLGYFAPRKFLESSAVWNVLNVINPIQFPSENGVYTLSEAVTTLLYYIKDKKLQTKENGEVIIFNDRLCHLFNFRAIHIEDLPNILHSFMPLINPIVSQDHVAKTYIDDLQFSSVTNFIAEHRVYSLLNVINQHQDYSTKYIVPPQLINILSEDVNFPSRQYLFSPSELSAHLLQFLHRHSNTFFDILNRKIVICRNTNLGNALMLDAFALNQIEKVVYRRLILYEHYLNAFEATLEEESTESQDNVDSDVNATASEE